MSELSAVLTSTQTEKDPDKIYNMAIELSRKIIEAEQTMPELLKLLLQETAGKPVRLTNEYSNAK